MPKALLRNDLSNVQVQITSATKARIRKDSPIIKVRNDTPILRTRFSDIKTNFFTIPAGTPIGLLLALTYAVATSVAIIFKGEAPTVSIRNTD